MTRELNTYLLSRGVLSLNHIHRLDLTHYKALCWSQLLDSWPSTGIKEWNQFPDVFVCSWPLVPLANTSSVGYS